MEREECTASPRCCVVSQVERKVEVSAGNKRFTFTSWLPHITAARDQGPRIGKLPKAYFRALHVGQPGFNLVSGSYFINTFLLSGFICSNCETYTNDHSRIFYHNDD
jgi:hypothetical protein